MKIDTDEEISCISQWELEEFMKAKGKTQWRILMEHAERNRKMVEAKNGSLSYNNLKNNR